MQQNVIWTILQHTYFVFVVRGLVFDYENLTKSFFSNTNVKILLLKRLKHFQTLASFETQIFFQLVSRNMWDTKHR